MKILSNGLGRICKIDTVYVCVHACICVCVCVCVCVCLYVCTCMCVYALAYNIVQSISILVGLYKGGLSMFVKFTLQQCIH